LHSSHDVAAAPSLERLIFETTDLDAVCAVASAAQHPLRADLLGPRRPLRFRLERRERPGISLSHVRFDYAGCYHVDAPPVRSHYHLQIPLRGGAVVRHGTREVATRARVRGLIVSPGEETRWRGSGGFEELTLNLDRRLLDRRWAELSREPAGRGLRFAPGLELESQTGEVIRTLARWCWNEVEGPSAAPTGVADALAGWLLLRIPHDRGDARPDTSAIVEESRVQDAEDWFLRCATRPTSVADAARRQGITARTLQRAFARWRTYTPREFMRRVRFERARERLRSAATHERVTDVAVSLGFDQLGQFSVDYRRRFGESPSTTLRRARMR
jgi:AraC-like DNA-binding protein